MRTGVLALAGLGLVLTFGCRAEPPALHVYAASSLTDVMERIAEAYDAATIEPNIGGSSTLARQIRDGAPADAFLSASNEWIDYLDDAGLIDGEPIVLASNCLVCVSPRGGLPSGRAVRDPADLLAAIGEGGRVAIADEGVPAGEYARAALERDGLLDAFRGRLVGQRDARAVLHAVESGELDAGFVYATDAAVADVVVLFELDPASHPPVEYRAAVVRGSAHREAARRFLEFLRGAAAREILADAGFSVPSSP